MIVNSAAPAVPYGIAPCNFSPSETNIEQSINSIDYLSETNYITIR